MTPMWRSNLTSFPKDSDPDNSPVSCLFLLLFVLVQFLPFNHLDRIIILKSLPSSYFAVVAFPFLHHFNIQ